MVHFWGIMAFTDIPPPLSSFAIGGAVSLPFIPSPRRAGREEPTSVVHHFCRCWREREPATDTDFKSDYIECGAAPTRLVHRA
jgi:hypothetical protein